MDLTKEVRRNLKLIEDIAPHFVQNVERVMEIGCFHGTTTNLFIDYFRDKTNGKLSSITCIDPWEDDFTEPGTINGGLSWKGQYETFCENTKRNSKWIEEIRCKSQDFLPQLNQSGHRVAYYDFVYIDGDHTEEIVYQDACNVLPLMKPGGFILFDDYRWGDYIGKPHLTPKPAIERFLRENAENVEVIAKNYQLLCRIRDVEKDTIKCPTPHELLDVKAMRVHLQKYPEDVLHVLNDCRIYATPEIGIALIHTLFRLVPNTRDNDGFKMVLDNLQDIARQLAYK